MQMISRATSAKATTSVRRMTGGNSPLLSGSGVPSCALGSWRSPGKGFVGGDLAARGLARLGSRRLGGRRLGGNDAHNGFPPPEAAMTRQQRRREPNWHHNVAGRRGFHRGSVSAAALDRMRRSVGRTEPPARGRVCWCRASNDAHLQRGSPMTQSFDRRPSSRVASALVFVSAVLLAPWRSPSAANAQMLGYASTQPNWISRR